MIFRVQYTEVGASGHRSRVAHEHVRGVSAFGRENVKTPRPSMGARVAKKCRGNRCGGGTYAMTCPVLLMEVTQIGEILASVPNPVETEQNIVVEIALTPRRLTEGETARD